MKKSHLLLIVLFILFSCSDNGLVHDQENSTAVLRAQKWFEQNVNAIPTTSPNGRARPHPKNALWGKGISYTKDKTLTIEVPLRYEPELIAYPQNINKGTAYKNLTKLLMFDDGRGGYNLYVMRIMPDMASLPGLEENTYNEKANTFSGKIVYYSWDGRPLVYATYENGKREELNAVTQSTEEENAASGARTEGDCYYVTTDYYQVVCVGSYCSDPEYLYSDYDMVCEAGPAKFREDGDLGGGGGGSGSGPGGVAPSVSDPCTDAEPASDATTSLSKTTAYASAKSSIQAADQNAENTVTFGRDANGNVTASSMTSCPVGSNNCSVNSNWPGVFADLHNHPATMGQPLPSRADMYNLIALNNNHSGYTTRMVVGSSSVYALVVLDLAAANTFKTKYPPQDFGNGPDFPEGEVFDTFQDVRGAFIQERYSELDSQERAMAYVMDKYNTGIVLLKQNSNGDFKRLKTDASTSNGNTTYTANNCQ